MRLPNFDGNVFGSGKLNQAERTIVSQVHKGMKTTRHAVHIEYRNKLTAENIAEEFNLLFHAAGHDRNMMNSGWFDASCHASAPTFSRFLRIDLQAKVTLVHDNYEREKMMGVSREPYAVVYKEQSGFKDVYGGAGGAVFVECMRIAPSANAQKRAIVFTHPIGSGSFLPLVTALAHAGNDVLYVNPRYRGNDTALIMEKCISDLGAALKDAQSRFGYESFILGGWSGGGSMSLFYQDQAENQTITHTPAGDAYDLTALDLPKVDGIMLLAAHISRAVTLTEWMDPSITDEARPFDRDPELNIYDPANVNQAPYDAAFVETFRAAQIARNRRITGWVKDQLAALKAAGEENAERAFVVHGTMADVRWTDPSQDPSDRRPYECYLGVPKIANDGPVGLARFTTLRSWLSQWGYDTTNATGLGNASRISCPVLVINNSADLACTPSHALRLFDAIGHEDKEYVEVKGADHYYIERADLLPQAVQICEDWLARKFG